MATKTKSPESHAPKAVPSVDQAFSEGLGFLNGGDLVAAAKAFTFVEAEAATQERLNLGRTARSYLAAIQARLRERGEPSKEAVEMTIQLLLNRKDAETALARIEKALGAASGRPALHYLKAVAHAQLGQAQESAEALARAVELEPDLIFQFRLEPDFEPVRHSAPFAALLRG
ncbi:MAG: tetratricopeptide repeat protein [Holophaga sp.]|jgi:predicted Zn-dependent protease